MRIKITFSLPGTRQLLPLNYQYPLSAWIYKVLARGDEQFAGFLHETGFQLENHKAFKLFTFSNLVFPYNKWRTTKGSDRMEIFADRASLIIAFQIPTAIEKFVAGLFSQQKAEIGDRISSLIMEVASIEMLPEPNLCGTVKIRALSPIVVSQFLETDKQEQYLRPGEANYEALFFKNLTDKHNAFLRQSGLPAANFEIEKLRLKCLTNKPQSRLQLIKANTQNPIKVRGFLYDFEIAAPPELIKTGLESGFGAMNALGFGCGEVVNNIKNIE